MAVAERKPKIVFLFNSYYPVSNGVSNCTRSMAQALAEEGYTVDVITCFYDRNVPRHETINGVNVHRILSYTRLGSRFLSILSFFIWEWMAALLLLRRIKPDYAFGMMLYYGYVFHVLKLFTQYKTITLAQGSDVDEVISFLQKLTVKGALRNCDVVCATNSEFKNKMHHFYPRSPIFILQNCLGKQDVRIEPYAYEFDAGYIHAVSVGRMVFINGIETKGMSHAIEAVAGCPAVMLHLFGDGPYRGTLERLVRERNLADRVVFHGQVPHSQLCDAMRRCDLLLFPSMTEGLSKTVIEACYLDLPIICTPIGGQKDFLKQDESVLFVECGNSNSIRAALQRFITDLHLRNKLKKGVKSVFERYFTYSAFVERFEGILKASDHSDRDVSAGA